MIKITKIELHTLNSISYALRHKWNNIIWANDLDKIIKKIESSKPTQAPKYKRKPTIRRNPKGCKKRYSRVNGVRQ